MNQLSTLAIAFVLVVSTVGAAPAAAAAIDGPSASTTATPGETVDQVTTENETETNETETNETETNETNETDAENIPPGHFLSGAIGVQEAEIDGEIETRALGLRLARAKTDQERAAVIAGAVENDTERVAELRQRHEELRQMREEGEISEGEYRARSAKIATQLRNVERTSNQTAEAASGLPVELLEERGVNATAIQELQNNASELRGNASAVAGDIGGPPEHAGRPDGVPGRDDETDADGGTENATRDGASDRGDGPDDAGQPDDAGPTDDRSGDSDGETSDDGEQDGTGDSTASNTTDDDAGDGGGNSDAGSDGASDGSGSGTAGGTQ